MQHYSLLGNTNNINKVLLFQGRNDGRICYHRSLTCGYESYALIWAKIHQKTK
ncbi:MAG: hypothetical protein LBP87_07775 [Planctomycetaceae bacterium]|nr:hypothetical protein [Planctomycetaceae bacterium]